MNVPVNLILVFVIVIPIAWFASEFRERRWVRLLLGSAVILLCFGVAYLAGTFQRLNYNAWYGGATSDLIDATITELEAGNKDRVLASLKKLQRKYSPTYENRASYDVLVEETVAEMRPPENNRGGPEDDVLVESTAFRHSSTRIGSASGAGISHEPAQFIGLRVATDL